MSILSQRKKHAAAQTEILDRSGTVLGGKGQAWKRSQAKQRPRAMQSKLTDLMPPCLKMAVVLAEDGPCCADWSGGFSGTLSGCL